MRASRLVLLVAVVLLAAAGLYYWWENREPPKLPPPPAAEAPTPPGAAQPTGPKYPLPAKEEPAPLPALKDSDDAVGRALAEVLGSETFQRYFVPEGLVRRIVATVDNLPRKTYAQRLNPVKGPGGMLATTGKDDTLVIAPDNGTRYAPYLAIVDRLDAARAVAVYARLYPLFQQAYLELGYPQGYFNDRLVEVIDHLLAAPEPHGPLKLTVPHVLYEYADPDLQGRSAGQKLMVRLGEANEAKVKAKLREIRKAITGTAL